MKNIICANNQLLQNITSILINRLSKVALNTEITLDQTDEETNQMMTVNKCIMNAEWCIGLKPTNRKGCYLLLTTCQQLNKARDWLDENLEKLFTEYIPQFQVFTPIDRYNYPK